MQKNHCRLRSSNHCGHYSSSVLVEKPVLLFLEIFELLIYSDYEAMIRCLKIVQNILLTHLQIDIFGFNIFLSVVFANALCRIRRIGTYLYFDLTIVYFTRLVQGTPIVVVVVYELLLFHQIQEQSAEVSVVRLVLELKCPCVVQIYGKLDR